MNKKHVCVLLTALLPFAACAAHNASPSFFSKCGMRASASFGPRMQDSQLMNHSAWDTAMRMSFSFLYPSTNKHSAYGLTLAAENSWNARFNSVNDVASTTEGPLLVHNSAAMDFLGLWSRKMGQQSIEVAAGAQVSWVKWLNSVQQTQSGVRVVPKVRIALSHHFNDFDMFVAFSQTFNTYSQLKDPSGTPNRFNDSGFVATSALMAGVSTTIA